MEDSTEEEQSDTRWQDKWKEKLGTIIHDKRFHILIIALIIVDVLVVLILLFVDLDVIPMSGGTEEEKHDDKVKVENGLHYFGLTVLCIFVIEIILRVFVDGKQFFRDKLNVFDATIVFLSFIFDLALTLAPVSNAVRDIVILMILLRLWRFFKLICTINICVRKDVKEELEKEKHARQLAEEERDFYKKKLQELEKFP